MNKRESSPVPHWGASVLRRLIPLSLASCRPPESKRYQPLGLLGEGEMGQVLRAADQGLERQVALKTMRPEYLGDADWVLRFVHEARATGRLEHPNIPAVHEIGVNSQGIPFFSMKLAQGKTLLGVIEDLRQGNPQAHAKWTFEARAQLVQKLCEAVDFAHQRGVVHRDIKPANVMVGGDGEVLLMDWGASYDRQATLRPAEYAFLGTASYAAPERFDTPESSLNPTSDIYSLGILMFELFTLQPAFQEHIEDLSRTVQSIQHKQLPGPESFKSSRQGRVPREYANIIRRATEKDPARRYPSASAMREALQAALQHEAPIVCPCTGMKRGLGLMERWIDNYGYVAGLLLMAWTLAPLAVYLRMRTSVSPSIASGPAVYLQCALPQVARPTPARSK